MDCHVVAHRNVVADFNNRLLIKSVEHRAVLYVDAVADGDGVYISAKHGAEPDAAFVTHRHVADKCGILCNKAVLADFGSKSSN